MTIKKKKSFFKFIIIIMVITVFFNFSTFNSFSEVNRRNFVEPSLFQQKSDDYLPVIISFNKDSYINDLNLFMEKFNQNFSLKYKFSIIPAISGYLSPKSLIKLQNLDINLNVFENNQYSYPNKQIEGEKDLKVNQISTESWWMDAIGKNEFNVKNLDGNGVSVGILDTGIGYNTSTGIEIHQDLQGRVGQHINFATGIPNDDVYDKYGHGTHVAGIIASSGVSSNGKYSGIAPGVQIYNVKVLNNSGSGFEDDIIKGIEWCVNESIDIINLSLGGGQADPNTPESMALTNASRQGVVCVVSSGNEGDNYYTSSSPSGANGIISVGSVDENYKISSFSSRGPNLANSFDPDIVAPGEGIISTCNYNSFLEKYYNFFDLLIDGDGSEQNKYIALDGTSMAAPMVSGAISLILEKFYLFNLSNSFIISSLMESDRKSVV